MERDANDTATQTFTCALAIALVGGALLFVHQVAGAIVLGMSLFPLVFGSYALGVRAWRSQRTTRPEHGSGHADGMPE